MPDWSSAMTVLNDEIGLIHITDAVAGIVIWELVSTASYEWGVFAGKREYRWTIWVHLLCRVANVLAYASFVALSSNRTASLCKALSTLGFVFSYTATTLSSFLIVLRIIAVWEKQRLISCLSILVWLASAALNFREVSLVFAEWNALGRGCVLVSGRTFIVNVPALLASDTSLLLLLLVGLLRKPGLVRRHGLYRVLLQQDIVWISVVALSTVPMLVLVVLDLNSPMNVIAQPISQASISICATRMYRALSDHSGSVRVFNDSSEPTARSHVRPRPWTEMDEDSAS